MQLKQIGAILVVISIVASILFACSAQDQNTRQNKFDAGINNQLETSNSSATKGASKNTAISNSQNVPSSAAPPPPSVDPLSPLEQIASGHQIHADKSESKRKSIALNSGPVSRQRIQSRRLARLMPAMPNYQFPVETLDTENYLPILSNRIHLAAEQPVSTFSIDVDTGSYSNVRRMLHDGDLPRHDAVRIEEFINYFSYDYPDTGNTEIPFNVITEMGPNPWNPDTQLLHVGIKAYDIDTENLPPANLVFLVDVSGSMNGPDKLPLLKNALLLLSNNLRSQDTVAIVVYAGASGTVLPPTSGDRKFEIATALENLSAGGSTNGASGIRLAYNLAKQSFVDKGINRVILATDGDFNVGTTNLAALKELVEKQRRSNITLTTLGFGRGNYNDGLMEQLADIGNGNYAYIDNLLEAQKRLVDEMGGTLLTIANDVKIQIEFNPDIVSEYRLIGYENRKLNREDFNNDKVDAGDIGAGHTVTALYEISLVNGKGNRIDPLRYQSKTDASVADNAELAFLKIRYKLPQSSKSKIISAAINQNSIKKSLQATTARFQFSASVAAFAQILRGGHYTKQFNLDKVIKLAQNSKGRDDNGYRGEFINLVKLANSLQGATSISLR